MYPTYDASSDTSCSLSCSLMILATLKIFPLPSALDMKASSRSLILLPRHSMRQVIRVVLVACDVSRSVLVHSGEMSMPVMIVYSSTLIRTSKGCEGSTLRGSSVSFRSNSGGKYIPVFLSSGSTRSVTVPMKTLACGSFSQVFSRMAPQTSVSFTLTQFIVQHTLYLSMVPTSYLIPSSSTILMTFSVHSMSINTPITMHSK